MIHTTLCVKLPGSFRSDIFGALRVRIQSHTNHSPIILRKEQHEMAAINISFSEMVVAQELEITAISGW